ncbi:unnamed protein product [Linum trigynum]|uniref:Uncharacterized protein n=1 Tax=Linum trigynum TaxID=586398 RepID=A0AAV2E0X8_9ROSI
MRRRASSVAHSPSVTPPTIFVEMMEQKTREAAPVMLTAIEKTELRTATDARDEGEVETSFPSNLVASSDSQTSKGTQQLAAAQHRPASEVTEELGSSRKMRSYE